MDLTLLLSRSTIGRLLLVFWTELRLQIDAHPWIAWGVFSAALGIIPAAIFTAIESGSWDPIIFFLKVTSILTLGGMIAISGLIAVARQTQQVLDDIPPSPQGELVLDRAGFLKDVDKRTASMAPELGMGYEADPYRRVAGQIVSGMAPKRIEYAIPYDASIDPNGGALTVHQLTEIELAAKFPGALPLTYRAERGKPIDSHGVHRSVTVDEFHRHGAFLTDPIHDGIISARVAAEIDPDGLAAALPVIGSTWMHHSQRIYLVLGFTNLRSLHADEDRQRKFPVTVVYMDSESVVYSLPVIEFLTSGKYKPVHQVDWQAYAGTKPGQQNGDDNADRSDGRGNPQGQEGQEAGEAGQGERRGLAHQEEEKEEPRS